MEVEVWGNVSLGARDNGEWDTALRIGQDVQQMNHVEQTQQPK